MSPAKARALDFTNVKERAFDKKHQPAGDYPGKVLKVEDVKAKSSGDAMWLFTIKAGRGTYPYYCKLDEANLWKIKNLWAAAGVNIPKKRVKIDPNKVVGKDIGVTLDDTEYEGKMQSEIAGTIPIDEVEEGETADTEDEEEAEEEEEEEAEEEEEEEEEEKPKKKKGKKKTEPDEDELEELDVEEL